MIKPNETLRLVTVRIDHHSYHAWIVAAWLGISCAAHPNPGKGRPAQQTASIQRDVAGPVWPRLQQTTSWPSIEYEVDNGGHSGAPYRVRLHIAPAAQLAYQQHVAGSQLPPGTTLAQFHRDARGAPGPIYVMEKHQAPAVGWSFTVLDASGHVQRTGDLPECSRCHAEAVSDYVFGPERAASNERAPR